MESNGNIPIEPLRPIILSPDEARMYQPLLLAYIGDAVFELMVRATLLKNNNCSTRDINKMSRSYVSARAQSHLFGLIEDMLTDDELEIYKRGRNAKSGSIPKNTPPVEYKRATGLEALFGYLYLIGDTQRSAALFDALWTDMKTQAWE